MGNSVLLSDSVMTGDTWWKGPIVIVALRLLYVEALATRASVSGSVVVFRFPIGARLLWGIATTALFIVLVRAIGHEELWMLMLGTGIVVSLCLGWPTTITLDEHG